MKNIAVADVRNFTLMGHTGSGKTTLADAILFKMGIADRLGSVDAGTSLSDYTEEEKNRNISVFASTFQGEYKTPAGNTYELTFCDTPGYMDFFGQVIAAARASETGLIVVDASAGIQVGTHRAIKCCQRRGVAARAIVITGLDKENTDFNKTFAEIQEAFGSGCVPVVMPTSGADAVVDVLAASDVPDDLAETVRETKGALVEMAAETDEALIEKYLEGEELTAEEIAEGLDVAVASGNLVPVFTCMPLKDIGISELLDGICRLFPSPERHEIHDLEDHVIDTAPDAPFTGLVWRSVIDPFVGQMSYLRVFSGTLRSDSEVYNVSKDKREKVSNLLCVVGKKQTPIKVACAGDIVAIPKLKDTHVGDTLAAPGSTTVIDPIHLPSPVTFVAVNAKTQADEDKIGTALQRLSEMDPTLRVERNVETAETVLEGLGDVHIDVAVSLMKSQSNVSVDLATPKIPYRETVTATGDGHYRHKKQSGGRGQFGEVFLRVEPLPEGDEEWFVNAVVGGAIPSNFMPAVQKGLVEGKQSGALAGYPVEKIKLTVYDGKYHPVDSSEVAFKIAAARAMRDAMTKAKAVLLEPIMTVKITIPDHYMGDINGDLNHKRGRIMGMSLEDGMQVIEAEVPRAELFRYAAELRSITSGQGSFEMAFNRYDIVPSNVAQKIIAETEKQKEEND